MGKTMKGLLLAAGMALVAGCATQPMPLDPNAQVPPPNHPAPVKSAVETP